MTSTLPTADGGAERVAAAMSRWDPSIALRLILGGDNAATWHALRPSAAATTRTSAWSPSTHTSICATACPTARRFDNCSRTVSTVITSSRSAWRTSPTRAAYARRAHDAGVTVISRDVLHHEPVEEAARRAVAHCRCGRSARLRRHRHGRRRPLARAGLSGRRAGWTERRRDASIRSSTVAVQHGVGGDRHHRDRRRTRQRRSSARFVSRRCWYSRCSRACEGDCNGRRDRCRVHSRARS